MTNIIITFIGDMVCDTGNNNIAPIKWSADNLLFFI